MITTAITMIPVLHSTHLLVEDGLGLTTITHLLVVVTSLALGEVRGLAGLVLGHLVQSVLIALLALAIGSSFLGNVHHFLHTCMQRLQFILSKKSRSKVNSSPTKKHFNTGSNWELGVAELDTPIRSPRNPELLNNT
jgi:hypothetical protein